MATPHFAVEDLLAECHARDYSGWRYRSFDDALVAAQLVKNGLLQHLSNSFLVVAERHSSEAPAASPFLAIRFSSDRIPAFASLTRFTSTAQGIAVTTEPLSQSALRTRPLGSGQILTIVAGSSMYLPGRPLAWELLAAQSRRGGLGAIVDALEPWFRFLLNCAEPDDSRASSAAGKRQLSALTVDGSYIDSTPFHLVRSENHLRLGDTEWGTSAPVPAGWIATRGLLHSLHVGVINQDHAPSLWQVLSELCVRAGIGITEAEVEAWVQMEADFQSLVQGVPITASSIGDTHDILVKVDVRLAEQQQHAEERLTVIESLERRLIESEKCEAELRLQLKQLRMGLALERTHPPVPSGREAWDEHGRARLRQLLTSDRRLTFPGLSDKATTSIILVLYNNAHLSLLCLESILGNAGSSYEVIAVDNASSDDTIQLLDRLDGVRVIRNRANLGFGEACAQGARESMGQYLCFLNNDALLEPGSLQAALDNFANNSNIGAVGGKLLFADGRLQEAGSILWSDGSADGYGRDDDPKLPQYEFRRPVDYCSAAFLVTPTALFSRLGGFSPDFHPAYYEDTDYCTMVWSEGLQVVYEPQAVVRHYESASSNDSDSAKPLIERHKQKFIAKWRDVLVRHLPRLRENIHRARFAALSQAIKVVYIDDGVPHRTSAGGSRGNDILRHLALHGHRITCVSLFHPVQVDYSDIVRDVELFDGQSDPDRLFECYLEGADIVWVSRPRNMDSLLQEIAARKVEPSFKIIYDPAENYGDRVQARTNLIAGLRDEILNDSMNKEIALARAADAVVCVSERDCQTLTSLGLANVHVVGPAGDGGQAGSDDRTAISNVIASVLEATDAQDISDKSSRAARITYAAAILARIHAMKKGDGESETSSILSQGHSLSRLRASIEECQTIVRYFEAGPQRKGITGRILNNVSDYSRRFLNWFIGPSVSFDRSTTSALEQSRAALELLQKQVKAIASELDSLSRTVNVLATERKEPQASPNESEHKPDRS